MLKLLRGGKLQYTTIDPEKDGDRQIILEGNDSVYPFLSEGLTLESDENGKSLIRFKDVLDMFNHYPFMLKFREFFEEQVSLYNTFGASLVSEKPFIDKIVFTFYCEAMVNYFDLHSNLDKLEANKVQEIMFTKTKRDEPRITCNMHYSCLGYNESENEHYGFSFLEESMFLSILDVPVELSSSTVEYRERYCDVEKHKNVVNSVTDKDFLDISLFDFVTTLMDEFTFHGSMEKSKEVMADLKERMEEVKSERENRDDSKND